MENNVPNHQSVINVNIWGDIIHYILVNDIGDIDYNIVRYPQYLPHLVGIYI